MILRIMANINRDDFRYLLDKRDIKVKNYPMESVVQLQIIKYLRAKGFACGKIKTKGGFSKDKFLFDPYTFRGCADLLCFTNTRMYFLEIKSAKGYLSQAQRDFQELCTNAGITYIIARCIEDVECIK